jgi:hypothetical protein
VKGGVLVIGRCDRCMKGMEILFLRLCLKEMKLAEVVSLRGENVGFFRS